jgi:hypothetical protein
MSISADSRFFFIHIMKTAGDTFRQHAYANFEAGEVYPAKDLDVDLQLANWSIDYVTRLPPERRARTRVYTGHFPFVTVELLGLDVITMTILRDPVDRTISRLRHRQHYDDQSRSMRLEEIYEDPFFFPMHIHNHQAKMFAITIRDCPESFMDVLDVDERRLGIAKRNLEQVDVLGFQERFDEFLGEVEQRYEWRFRALRRGHGVPPLTSDIPRSFRKRIGEDNAADVAFYEHARDLDRHRRRGRVHA